MPKNTQPPAILLMGPTASGKTAVAVQLAATLPCEIISVDSALIYRGMDIGTAKPDAETLARAPHHLINVIDPHESYSAARFRDDALALMAEHRGITIPKAGPTTFRPPCAPHTVGAIPGRQAGAGG